MTTEEYENDGYHLFTSNIQAVVNSLEDHIESSFVNGKVTKEQARYCKKILSIINESDKKDHERIFELTCFCLPEDAYFNLLKMGFNHS